MPDEVARAQPLSRSQRLLNPTARLYILPTNSERARTLLRSLEVVEQDRPLLRLLTPVLDHDTGAVDHLTGVALAIENA